MATAVDAGERALELVLASHLVLVGIDRIWVLDSTVNVLTDIERAFSGIGAPPTDACLVVGSLVPYFPVDLRYVVVHPPLA